MQDTSTITKCVCLLCKYFEPRSSFCRKNPPHPIVINDEHGTHITSAFPKINCPTLDWCSYFEKINAQIDDD